MIRRSGHRAAVVASLLVLFGITAGAAGAAAPLDADTDPASGWTASWEPLRWAKPGAAGTELALRKMPQAGDHGPSAGLTVLRGDHKRTAARESTGQVRWVRLGDARGRTTVLWSQCRSSPAVAGWSRRSAGVPVAGDCDLVRVAPDSSSRASRVPQSSPDWSEGVAAQRGEWLAISRSRAGHDPEVRVWRRGKLVRVLRGPLGTGFTKAQRQFGAGAAGAADLALFPSGKLAVVWQTPRTAKHCASKAGVKGSFDRDLVTVDLTTGSQRWVNHAGCADPEPSFDGPRPVEMELVGWEAGGQLVVEDPLKVCAVVVPTEPAAPVAQRAYDVTSAQGGFAGGQNGVWRDLRRVSGRGLEATILANPRVSETPRFQGWFSSFVPTTVGANGCQSALLAGAPPSRPGGYFR